MVMALPAAPVSGATHEIAGPALEVISITTPFDVCEGTSAAPCGEVFDCSKPLAAYAYVTVPFSGVVADAS